MAKYGMQSKYTHEVDEKYKAGWERIFGKSKKINKTKQTKVDSKSETGTTKSAG